MPRIRGAKKAAARIRALGGTDTERVVTKALYAAGSLIETDMAHSITEGSVSGKNHVPSASGEPPERRHRCAGSQHRNRSGRSPEGRGQRERALCRGARVRNVQDGTSPVHGSRRRA